MITPAIQLANGYCVSWTCGGGYFELYYTPDWDEAVAAYSEPPMGYSSAGISACKDGVPFAKLDAPTIVQIVRPGLGRTLRNTPGGGVRP